MIYRNAGLSVKVIITIAIVLFIFSTQQSNAQTITTGQTGTNGGYYYSFWNAGGGSVTMTLGAAGNYSVTWTNCNNFTCGKGWSKGSNAPVCFTSTFNGGGNGYLAVYGWTTNPLIEYYIVENHGSWTPPGGTSLGTVTTDGGTYKIYKMTRTNAPSIQGTATFNQYWSVRTTTRLSGTITVANHFAAWANLGLNLGTFNYEIMETEGYQSTGSSNVTVGAGCDATGAGSYGNGETGGENKIDFAGKDILVALPSNIRSGPVVVRIFGLSGKRFFESSLDPCNALLKISTPDLPAGAYYLSIQDRDRAPVIPFVKTR